MKPKPTFEIGETVRYRAPNGSYGRIKGTHVGLWYARWCYGVDVKGEPIEDDSGLLHAEDLIRIDEEFYMQYTSARAWSEEQSQIAAAHSKKSA